MPPAAWRASGPPDPSFAGAPRLRRGSGRRHCFICSARRKAWFLKLKKLLKYVVLAYFCIIHYNNSILRYLSQQAYNCRLCGIIAVYKDVVPVLYFKEMILMVQFDIFKQRLAKLNAKIRQVGESL